MLIDSGIYTFGRVMAYEIMNVYTMKIAGVFMISTCTLSLRTGIFPRWMVYILLANLRRSKNATTDALTIPE